ncbi:MAG: hypothetical protein QM813_02550 [Verrucomicrobiota bacterium]
MHIDSRRSGNARQQRDTATATLTESKVALASEEQMWRRSGSRPQSLEQRVRELTQVIEQRKRETPSSSLAKRRRNRRSQDSQSKIERVTHEREQVNAQAAELFGHKQAQEAGVTRAMKHCASSAGV